MIVVKVELWPFGSESRKRILGEAHIINDATGSKTKGNYKFKLFKKNKHGIWKTGEIKNFPRLRRNGYDLLYLCLKQIVGDRNGE